MPRYFYDLADGGEVIKDPDGVDFVDLETAIAEAVGGAREVVAHGIMMNEDLSGQSFLIRDEDGQTRATVRFRDTLPGKLRG
jgi:hypothetical protein